MDNGGELPKPQTDTAQPSGPDVPVADPTSNPPVKEDPTAQPPLQRDPTAPAGFPDAVSASDAEIRGEKGAGQRDLAREQAEQPTAEQIRDMIKDSLPTQEARDQWDAIDAEEISDEEKDQKKQALLDELIDKEKEKQPGEEETEPSEEQKLIKQKAEGLLKEGQELLHDTSPEAEEKRQLWLKDLWDMRGSPEAKELYKQIGIVLFLQLLALAFAFVKLQVGGKPKG